MFVCMRAAPAKASKVASCSIRSFCKFSEEVKEMKGLMKRVSELTINVRWNERGA
jgi:hypothetical protein